MAKARVEERLPGCGFVYTAHTRMLYAPKHTATRRVEDRSLRDLCLQGAARWPEPSMADISAAIDALVAAYPDRTIWGAATDGLEWIGGPSPDGRAELPAG